ncbi:MAG: hypothetical protein NXI22_07410 [bacterium]|nr:hypothetical protein [bacterium]
MNTRCIADGVERAQQSGQFRLGLPVKLWSKNGLVVKLITPPQSLYQGD